ncbi:gamma-glutamyl-gamma-aminobutyrate hydrolase family protein [Alphaproteobacteria bacterium]|nr:gamma-glutamyl-gamma-aminobutyrate hydrolase family protein [Alphaproteobacteria bacterium]
MKKHHKPIIGITTDYEEENKSYSQYPWFALRENYIKSCEKYGANCIILPISKDSIDLNLLDGLVITGGNFDIHPKFFGQKINNKKVKIKSKRTNYEMNLLKKFFKLNKPILGICGGAQLINVFDGGSLIQDINTNINHEQPNPRNETGHDIEIISKTYLNKIYRRKLSGVNSAHHQAVDIIGENLEINARSSDGIVEAFKHRVHFYCLGIQWHPEFLITKLDETIIKDFIKHASHNS